MVDIFRDPTKSLPKSDSQIVRVDMKQLDMGGRTGHIPTPSKSGDMGLSHVPNAGAKR